MATEAEFWAAIKDAYEKLADERAWLDVVRVMADWLQDQGDPRAQGYWIMGTLRLRPSGAELFCWYDAKAYPDGLNDPWSDLPTYWFKKLKGHIYSGRRRRGLWSKRRTYQTLKEGMDAAAIAFAELGPIQKKRLVAIALRGSWKLGEKYPDGVKAALELTEMCYGR